MTKNAAPPHIVHFSSVHQVGDVRVFLKECRSLAAAGYRVTLIARGHSSDEVDGVVRIAVGSKAPGGRIGRMVLGTSRVVRLAWVQRGDVYHFHDPELIPFGLLMKLLGKRVIYDAHENIRDQLLSKSYLPRWSRKGVARAMGVLEDFATRRFDGVVTATPRIAQTLMTSHTVEVSNFPVREEILQQQSEAPRDPGKVVFVGGFTSIRGAREMVQAIALVNESVPARLVICGSIPSGLREALVNESGWQYVDDLGWLARAETQEQMASASCGLCVYLPVPNHVEAVPNKLFEYMGAGLPVIASDFPFWRQFVEETDSGLLVDPKDPAAIAAAIVDILRDPAAVVRMGSNGVRAVENRFNWDRESRKLLALYSEILGSSARSGQF